MTLNAWKRPHCILVIRNHHLIFPRYLSIKPIASSGTSTSDIPSVVEGTKQSKENISEQEEYYNWTSLKSIHDKVKILLHQCSLDNQTSRLLPRHQRLKTQCSEYWRRRFSKVSRVEENNAVGQSHIMYIDSISDRTHISALVQTLSKVYKLNTKLASLADITIAAGESSQFLRLCHALRKKSKTHKGLESGTIVLDAGVNESLARHFASSADWPSLNALFKRLELDGLPLTPRMYLYGIECLGRLLDRVTTSSDPTNLLVMNATHTAPQLRLIVSPNETRQKIIKLLDTLVDKAESQGFELIAHLSDLPRTEATMEYISNGFRCTHGFSQIQEPGQHWLSTSTMDCKYPVEWHLDCVHHKLQNPFAQAIPESDELLNAFECQLRLERRGAVRITPVLPPFPAKNDQRGNGKKSISEGLRQRLHDGLMEEQLRWRSDLLEGFNDLLQRLKLSHSRDQITVYPFLKILPAAQYVDLMIKAIDNVAFDSALQHVSSYVVCLKLGQHVEDACQLYRKEKMGILKELKDVYTAYAHQFNQHDMKSPQFRLMWREILQSRFEQQSGPSLHQDWPQWTSSVHFMVGRALYDLIYDRVTFDRHRPILIRHQEEVGQASMIKVSNKSKTVSGDSPVLFEVLTELVYEMRNEVKIHPTLANWYRDACYPPLSFHPAELPMLCPPVPWTSTRDAGYLISRNYATRLMRQNYSSPVADPALNDDLDFDAAEKIPSVLDALNCLAACPWRVNESVLDSLIQVAREGGNHKLKIPETSACMMPAPLPMSTSMTYQERRAAYRRTREAHKQYDETRSLWATELYRLSIANEYRGHVFWFPHSMDFRGRVYPCPPHFHHMGNDVARGLIVFAKGLPLGACGLDWLKIHLVNLTGLKKRSSNAERLEYADMIMDDVLDSARNPFGGRRWWQDQEEPWQTLACCKELAEAFDHPQGPEKYISNFPVHQDGSCNGLQHYAALGRDGRGAESVNLVDMPCPRDVYGDVVEVVESQRRIDAASGLPVAQLLEGFVRRKVIKQSVMTTVYGVTLYGASEQIRRQLRDLHDFPNPEWIGPAAAYLARLTLSSIGKIFTSSTEIQAWFGQLAHHISHNFGARVSWETPLGLPVTQPYMKLTNASWPDRSTTDLTNSSPFSPPPSGILGPSALEMVMDRFDNGMIDDRSTSKRKRRRIPNFNQLPVANPVKQKNAFPPNFVHSLDSCHMMLTALHCFRESVTFASVHDCFWTHAATVDRMNQICREEFIALHSEPILHNLADYLRSKFAFSSEAISQMDNETERAKALAFNRLLDRVPELGTFDLNAVRKSTYFFS